LTKVSKSIKDELSDEFSNSIAYKYERSFTKEIKTIIKLMPSAYMERNYDD
jgi:hypothetical protein